MRGTQNAPFWTASASVLEKDLPEKFWETEGLLCAL